MAKMIKEAAIRQENKIYTGKRHDLIIKDMVENYGLKLPIKGEQGFVTDSGDFVDRIMAAKIATESGQIKKLNWPPNLYSEDLLN